MQRMNAVAINKFFSDKSQRQKIVRTVALTVGWICLGLHLTITGPTLIDLKLRMGVNYDQISTALTGHDIGHFVGAALGGILVTRYLAWCDIMVGAALTLAAVATVCIPYTTSLRLLWFFSLLNGTTPGILDVAGQKLALMLWQKRSPGPLNIVHGGFGIGAFIVPLIANPFLAVIRNLPMSNNSRAINTSEIMPVEYPPGMTRILQNSTDEYEENKPETYTQSTHTTETIKESRIEIAYLIVAIVVMANSFIFYIFQVSNVKRMKHFKTTSTRESIQITKQATCKTIKDMFNPATCADGHALYGAAIFTVLFLFYFNLVGVERILSLFIRAYSIEQLGFSVDSGSYANMVYFISYFVGRFAGFFAARWIPIRILLLVNCVGILIWSVLLNIFAANNSLAFWILVPALGIFVGPAFPIGMGWGNYHVELTGMALCLLMLCTSLGGWVHVRLGGYLFETFGPRVFLHHLLGINTALFVLSIILHVISMRRGNRYKNKTSGRGETVLEVLDEGNTDRKTQI